MVAHSCPWYPSKCFCSFDRGNENTLCSACAPFVAILSSQRTKIGKSRVVMNDFPTPGSPDIRMPTGSILGSALFAIVAVVDCRSNTVLAVLKY